MLEHGKAESRQAGIGKYAKAYEAHRLRRAHNPATHAGSEHNAERG